MIFIMKKTLFIILSFIVMGSYAQQFSQKFADLNYADDAKSYHLLDIYLPTIERDSYPVIVYIYGSAWYSNNSKGSDMNTIGSKLLDAGYAIATPNHRSSSDTLFPGQIHDIKAVIRYLRGNCEKYKLDTTFIGISGSSSGGHLAALAGTTSFVDSFKVDSITMNMEGSLGKYTSFSSDVDAVCDWFGPTDLLLIDSCRGSSFGTPGQTPEEAMIGEKKTVNTTKFKLANPITFADPKDPPFLIFHGDADVVVPYCESELLNLALKSVGVQSEYIQVPGGQHYSGTHTEANFLKMVDFFNGVSKINTSGSIGVSDENNDSFSFKISENRIEIQNNDDIDKIDYRIIDISGKEIRKNQIHNNQIDISFLKNGIYILNISHEGELMLSERFNKS